METDAELLRQYIKEGSEAAFGELVRRYLGLVYSAAMRQAAGDRSLAEDATQAVFIILARQGPLLVGHESLAGWLHTCTRYTTLRVLRGARRRQARELKAAAMEINEAPKTSWDEVRPILDEAVGSLNPVDRQAVLLRFFQGRSHREVGAALGVTEDAARVRVDRALEKLRRNFARRGIITTSVLLGEAILRNSAEAEPAGLAGRVKTASAAGGAFLGWGGWMLRLMLMNTKKKVLTIAMLLVLAGLFTWSWPGWAGPSAPDKPARLAGAQTTAALPQRGQPAVQAPQMAPASAASTNAPAAATAPAAMALSPPPPGGRGARGANFGPGGNRLQNQYRNLFQKLNFTPDQQQAFLKILNDRQDQLGKISRAATSKFTPEQYNELSNNIFQQVDYRDPKFRDPWVLSQTMINKVHEQLGIADQLKDVNDAADVRLRAFFGSEANYQAYQTYTSQEGVRQWVMYYYENALQSSGVPGLTPEQQEALVAVVANSLQPGDWGKLKEVSQVIGHASSFLTPEQIEVLKLAPEGAGLDYAQLHQAP